MIFKKSMLYFIMKITAFATESTISKNGGKQEIDVNAKYIDGVEVPTVYNVDVAWRNGVYILDEGGQGYRDLYRLRTHWC